MIPPRTPGNESSNESKSATLDQVWGPFTTFRVRVRVRVKVRVRVRFRVKVRVRVRFRVRVRVRVRVKPSYHNLSCAHTNTSLETEKADER